MPLDPSIYSQVGKVNLGAGIADELNQFTNQRAAQQDRQNRLAQLAMQMQEHQAKQEALASLPPEARNYIRLGGNISDLTSQQNAQKFMDQFNKVRAGVPAPTSYAQGDINAPLARSNATVDAAGNPTGELVGEKSYGVNPAAIPSDADMNKLAINNPVEFAKIKQGMISSGLAQPAMIQPTPEQMNDLIAQGELNPNKYVQKGIEGIRKGEQFQQAQDAKVLAAQQHAEVMQAMQNNAIANRPDIQPIQTVDKNGNVTLWDKQGNKIKDLGIVGKPQASSVYGANMTPEETGALDQAIQNGLDPYKINSRTAKIYAQQELLSHGRKWNELGAQASFERSANTTNTKALLNTINPLLDKLVEKGKEMTDTGSPLLNAPLHAAQKYILPDAMGGAAVTGFDNLRDDTIAEVERGLLGTGVLSDSKYQRALANLNSAQTATQRKAAVDNIKFVINQRLESLAAGPNAKQIAQNAPAANAHPPDIQQMIDANRR